PYRRGAPGVAAQDYAHVQGLVEDRRLASMHDAQPFLCPTYVMVLPSRVACASIRSPSTRATTLTCTAPSLKANSSSLPRRLVSVSERLVGPAVPNTFWKLCSRCTSNELASGPRNVHVPAT